MYDSLAPLFDDLFGGMDPDGPISIYEHVLVHLDPSGVGLTEGGDVLPDDALYTRSGMGLSFVPGAREAVIAYHGERPNNADAIKAIIAAAKAYGQSPNVETLRAFYTILRREEMVTVIDDVLTAFADFPEEVLMEVLRAAMAFLYKAPDRGPVKFALAVLGQTDEEELIEDFQVLARHEEFTVYAAVALEKVMEEPLDALFQMAKSVTGWGRIEVVHRLSGWPKREYREWLITEGFRNTVLDEYLAYIAATDGQLLNILRASEVSDTHLQAAGEIITALIRGGPAQDMTDYEDGAAVVELYLDALMGRQMSITQFVSLFEIQDFLDDVDVNWDMRMAYGWTPHRREALSERVAALLQRTDVLPQVEKDLLSDDTQAYETALQAADLLDLPLWDIVFQRLAQRPNKAIRWYDAAKRMTSEEVPALLSLARGHFDLVELSAGPEKETGVGSEFGVHDALMFVVQELARFPGEGWDLVSAALMSPIVPSRWTAVRTIDMWSTLWTDAVVTEALERLWAVEPVDDLKDYVEQVLERVKAIANAPET